LQKLSQITHCDVIVIMRKMKYNRDKVKGIDIKFKTIMTGEQTIE